MPQMRSSQTDAPPVIGWDLSVLGDRILVGPLPWDFDEIVERHARVGVTVVAAERVAADGPLTLTLPAFCLRGVKPSSA